MPNPANRPNASRKAAVIKAQDHDVEKVKITTSYGLRVPTVEEVQGDRKDCPGKTGGYAFGASTPNPLTRTIEVHAVDATVTASDDELPKTGFVTSGGCDGNLKKSSKSDRDLFEAGVKIWKNVAGLIKELTKSDLQKGEVPFLADKESATVKLDGTHTLYIQDRNKDGVIDSATVFCMGEDRYYIKLPIEALNQIHDGLNPQELFDQMKDK